jgi:glycosyltransferase involved in cell wall biosynthesis
VAKDPLWAFDVVQRLRKTDDRYRLLLIGSDFAGEKSAAAGRYAERLHKRLEALEAEGVVQRVGQTDDVPGALTEVGIILSASVRESFHAALVEGAASGAVPVVRDWPFFAGRATSARTLFPADWVVETPDEAAQRIITTTGDADTWRASGAAASEHAVATWDWSVVAPGYERFFLH